MLDSLMTLMCEQSTGFSVNKLLDLCREVRSIDPRHELHRVVGEAEKSALLQNSLGKQIHDAVFERADISTNISAIVDPPAQGLKHF